jgi:hypothetical protein
VSVAVQTAAILCDARDNQDTVTPENPVQDCPGRGLNFTDSYDIKLTSY